MELRDIDEMGRANSFHYYNEYYRQLEHNVYFPEYKRARQIKILLRGLSEDRLKLYDIYIKFPQLFMEVCNKYPDKDAYFLRGIPIPDVYLPIPHVTNENYRRWYMKLAVQCIQTDVALLRFVHRNIVKEPIFAEMVATEISDIGYFNPEISNYEKHHLPYTKLLEKMLDAYQDDIDDVPELSSFFENYLSILLRDKGSLRVATQKSLTGRLHTNYTIKQFLGNVPNRSRQSKASANSRTKGSHARSQSRRKSKNRV